MSRRPRSCLTHSSDHRKSHLDSFGSRRANVHKLLAEIFIASNNCCVPLLYKSLLSSWPCTESIKKNRILPSLKHLKLDQNLNANHSHLFSEASSRPKSLTANRSPPPPPLSHPPARAPPWPCRRSPRPHPHPSPLPPGARHPGKNHPKHIDAGGGKIQKR